MPSYQLNHVRRVGSHWSLLRRSLSRTRTPLPTAHPPTSIQTLKRSRAYAGSPRCSRRTGIDEATSAASTNCGEFADDGDVDVDVDVDAEILELVDGRLIDGSFGAVLEGPPVAVAVHAASASTVNTTTDLTSRCRRDGHSHTIPSWSRS